MIVPPLPLPDNDTELVGMVIVWSEPALAVGIINAGFTVMLLDEVQVNPLKLSVTNKLTA